MIINLLRFTHIATTLAAENPVEGWFQSIYAFTNLLEEKLFTLYHETLSALTSIAVDNIPSQIGSYKDLFLHLGQTLAALFLIVEIFTTMVGFRFERLEDAVRIGLKFVACKVVIENTDPIARTIYSIFFSKGFEDVYTEAKSYYTQANGMMTFSITSTGDGGILGIGFLVMAICNLIVIFILGAFILKIIAHLAGIIFELGIHQVLAPIALSTLCNDNAKSTGIAWIKSYAAVCLQATIMAICFKINSFVIENLSTAMKNTFDNSLTTLIGDSLMGVIFNILMPLFGMMLLTAALDKSGDITKRMLGA